MHKNFNQYFLLTSLYNFVFFCGLDWFFSVWQLWNTVVLFVDFLNFLKTIKSNFYSDKHIEHHWLLSHYNVIFTATSEWIFFCKENLWKLVLHYFTWYTLPNHFKFLKCKTIFSIIHFVKLLHHDTVCFKLTWVHNILFIWTLQTFLHLWPWMIRTHVAFVLKATFFLFMFSFFLLFSYFSFIRSLSSFSSPLWSNSSFFLFSLKLTLIWCHRYTQKLFLLKCNHNK